MKLMIKKGFSFLANFKSSEVWSGISFYSLCTALALVPFNAYWLKRALYLAILSCAVYKFLTRQKLKVESSKLSPMSLAWIIFLGAMSVTLIFSNDFADSVSYFFERILLYAAMFWVSKETVVNKKRLRQLIAVLVLTALVVSLDAVWQFFSGKDIFFGYEKSDGGRALTGPFGMHNYFSGYLEMLVPFVLVLSFLKIRIKERILIVITAIALVFSLIYDYQRATLVAAILCASVGILVLKRKYLKWLIIVFALICLLLPSAFKQRFVQMVRVTQDESALNVDAGHDEAKPKKLRLRHGYTKVDDELRFIAEVEDKTILGVLKPGWDNGRLGLWKSAIYLFKTSPIVGHGLNAFERFENAHPELWLNSIHAHNTYLQLMAETGILGLLSFLYLLGVYWFYLLQYLRKKECPARVVVVAAGSAILCSMLVALICNNMLVGVGFPLIYWTLMSLSSNIIAARVEGLNEEK